MRRRFFIIFNPAAGRQRRAALRQIVAALELRGGAVTLQETASGEEARAAVQHAVASRSYDAVVAAGGDGTVRQAACALAGAAMPLGYIPLGTGNVLAHELDLDRSAAAVAHMLMRGPVMPVEMAAANGEPFLLMAGIGFDGRIIAALDHRLKNRIGKAAFVPPSLQALVAPLDQLRVEVDGVERRATWAVVANARHYGGQFVIAPKTGLLRPGLSVILFQATSKTDLLRQLADLGLGRLEARVSRPGGGVEMLAADRVTITTDAALPLQIDGDAFGMASRLEVASGQQSVNLIMP